LGYFVSNYGALELYTSIGGASSGKIIFTGTVGTGVESLKISGPENSGRIALTTYQSSPITLNGGNILINLTVDEGFKLNVSGSTKLNGNTQITGSLSITSTLNVGNSQFNNTSSATSAGTTVVSSIATGSFNSAFYRYSIASASNARAGEVMSVWSGSVVRFSEFTTTDIGNTSTAVFSVAISSGNVVLNLSSSGGWNVKSIANLL